MNEYDAMKLWRKYYEKYGAYTVRIENVGSSLPDMMWMHDGIVGFNEAKMIRGNCFYMPKYQWSNIVVLSKHLKPWQILYAVYNKGTFEVYNVEQIKYTNPEPAGLKLKVNLLKLMPMHLIHDFVSFQLFLNNIIDMSNKHTG
jgi:hypothetical protein